MPKHSFTMYLLKNGIIPEKDGLKENHNLEKAKTSQKNIIIYISKETDPIPLWWVAYFGIKNKIENQVYNSAVIFINTKNKRWVALTFGMGYHKLKEDSYESDFGLKTTLKLIKRESVLSTDIIMPETLKRQRTQLPTSNNIDNFDIKKDESILKSVTGKTPKDLSDDFKDLSNSTMSGANSLHFSTTKELDGLKNLCDNILNLYLSDQKDTNFSDFFNLSKIDQTSELDHILCNAIKSHSSSSTDSSLYISIPKIVDFAEIQNVRYEIFEDIKKDDNEETEDVDEISKIDFNYFIKLIDKDKIKDNVVDSLKKSQLIITYDNDNEPDQIPLFKCLGFEYNDTTNKSMYCLCEGNWYLINKDLVTNVRDYVDKFFIDKPDYLPDYNKELEGEGKYNEKAQNTEKQLICLDRQNIAPTGRGNVEPCDLIKNHPDGFLEMIHIKRETKSAMLSHLFNQGLNSLILLMFEEESREKMISIIKEAQKDIDEKIISEFSDLIKKKNMKVIYGIITDKVTNKSKSLPFFSSLTLYRTLKQFELMGKEAKVCYIPYTNSQKK